MHHHGELQSKQISKGRTPTPTVSAGFTFPIYICSAPQGAQRLSVGLEATTRTSESRFTQRKSHRQLQRTSRQLQQRSQKQRQPRQRIARADNLLNTCRLDCSDRSWPRAPQTPRSRFETRDFGRRSKVALTIVTQSQAPLSLQQHLDIVPDILNCSAEALEGELQPLMMAQAVPNPPNDKKRVKVYELRNQDWYDRGTGFCTAGFIFVRLSSHVSAYCLKYARFRLCLGSDQTSWTC